MTYSETEIVKIIELGKEFPNNQDLGKKFRSLYRSTKIAKSLPNDSDLGKELRRILEDIKELNFILNMK
jgi:hypothetical protein